MHVKIIEFRANGGHVPPGSANISKLPYNVPAMQAVFHQNSKLNENTIQRKCYQFSCQYQNRSTNDTFK